MLMPINQVLAMDATDYGEFQKLMQTPVRILADKAETILADKYENMRSSILTPPSSQLQLSGLPAFATTNRTVNIAYRIAAKKQRLLAGYSCYDPACESLELRTLLDCFYSWNNPGEFAEHAAKIDTCRTEALLVFLWSEFGAKPGDIEGALRFMFDPSVHESQPITP
jgi:hypothetical protein